MTDRIASGEVYIGIDDKSALAGLRKVEAEFEKTMAKIDRDEATATINVDTKKFDLEVKQAERKLESIDRSEAVAQLWMRTAQFDNAYKKAQLELKQLQGQKAEAQLGVDPASSKRFDDAIKKAQLEVKRLDGERATAHLELKFNEAEFKAAEARVKAIQARTTALENVTAKAHANEAKRQAAELKWTEQKRKVSESLWKQQLRELSQAEQAAHRMDAQREKEMQSIPKLRSQYAQLAYSIEKLNESRRKVKRNPDAAVRIDLKIDDATSEMMRLKKELQRLGDDPPVTVNIHPGADFGRNMRHTIDDGLSKGGILTAAKNAGVLASREFSAGMSTGVRKNLSGKSILAGLTGVGAKIGHALGGLSDMTVRLGPFTATIRQAFVGLSVLAPVILDVVGALGSLVSVAGSAALGIGALSAGFLGGAIPAALGMGLVIKNVGSQFVAAQKATKAYNDTVMKNGKGSDQAKKKLDELRSVMGHVSSETAKQVGSAHNLNSEWQKLTAPARASVWKSIGNAIGTAGKLMPMFAKNTNESMGIAEKATSKWMKAIANPEGRHVLNTMMDNFNRSLGPGLDGLGKLAGYLAKVGAVASGSLPGLAREFDNWATGVNHAADGSEKFRQKIAGVIDSAKSVGRFLLAAGRLMKSFFGGGVDAGRGFTDTMTAAMNRWTAFLNTTKGQNNLKTFFSEAVHGAETLWGVLAPLVASFAKWAMLIAPAVRLLLQGAAAASQFVAALLKLTGLQGPVSALITTLGVLWGIGKISAATRAVGEFTKALVGMGVVQERAAAAGALSSVAAVRGAGISSPIIGGVAAAREAEVAAAATTRLGRAATVGKTALTGLGAATLGTSTVVGGLAVVAAAAGFGIYKYMTRTRDWEKAANAADSAQQRMIVGQSQLFDNSMNLAQGTLDLASSHIQLKNTVKQSSAEEKKLNQLRNDGKKGTKEYNELEDQHKQTLLDVSQARLTDNAAIKRRIDLSNTDMKQSKQQVTDAQKALKLRKDSLKDLGDNKDGSFLGIGGTKTIDSYNKIAAAAKKVGMSVKAYIHQDQGFTATELVPGANLAKVGQYATKLDQVTQREKLLADAENKAALSGLNHARALQRMAPIAYSAATAFAAVGRSLGKSISLKFSDPAQAANVAKSAAAALKSGVPKQIVTKLIGDSKSAEDAIARVNSKGRSLAAAKFTSKLGATDAASATISKIIARVNAIPNKNARIKAMDAATSTIARILARVNGIPSKKTARLIAQDLISGKVAAAQAAINALHGKSITIDQVTRKSIVGSAKGAVHASGKMMGMPSPNALIGEGRAGEWRVNPKTGMVYKTTGPQFADLTKNDAIIPTEPKHRSTGRDILKSIAKDLGMQSFASGRGSAYHGEVDNGYYKPSTNLGKPPPIPKTGKTVSRSSSSFTKRKKTAYASGRGYVQYIAGLKTAQDDWEQEVGLRQSQVREPDSLIVEQGRLTVTNPETGQPEDVGPNMVVDSVAIAKYKDDLASVQDAFTQLLHVITTLITAIPQALSAISVEETYRKANIQNLDQTISTEKGIIAAHSKGTQTKSDKEIIARHTKLLNSAQTNKENEQSQLDTIKEDRGTLNDDQRTAGFSYRETQIEANKNGAELSAVSGNAVQQATDANTQALTSTANSTSSAAGDGTPTPYLQQVADLSTAKGDLYKQFGGNSYSSLATVMTGSSNSDVGAAQAAGGAVLGSNMQGSARAAMAVSQPMASMPAASSATGAPASSSGLTATFNQTFNQLPDPHTWSQGVAYELQAAV